MKATILLMGTVILTVFIAVECKGQRFARSSSTVAFNAMNTGSTSFSNVNNINFNLGAGTAASNGSLYGSTSIPPGGGYRPITIYPTSVTVNYFIPNTVFWDWIDFHRDAIDVLSFGQGNPNYPNYLPSDVPTLIALAYDNYVNPNAYGARTLKLQVRQWNGNLNWYSSTAGGGQLVKNWVTLFLPVSGTMDFIIK